jgi:hypothetical protein
MRATLVEIFIIQILFKPALRIGAIKALPHILLQNPPAAYRDFGGFFANTPITRMRQIA